MQGVLASIYWYILSGISQELSATTTSPHWMQLYAGLLDKKTFELQLDGYKFLNLHLYKNFDWCWKVPYDKN